MLRARLWRAAFFSPRKAMTDSTDPSIPDPSETWTAPPRRSRWKRVVVILALVAGLSGLAVSLIPEGIRLLAVKMLAEDGQRTVAIDSLHLNPFTGLVIVEGLAVNAPDGRGLRVGRLLLDLNMLALTERRVHLRRLRVERASLDLIRTANGVRPAGFAEDTDKVKEQETNVWQAGVDRLALRDANITLHDPDRSDAVKIDRLDIADIAMWDIDRSSELLLSAALPQGDVELSGQVRPLAKAPDFNGKLTLRSVDLARALRLAAPGAASPVRGEITASLDLQLALAADSAVSVAAKGNLSAKELEITGGTQISSPVLNHLDARFTIGASGTTARVTGTVSAARIVSRTGNVSFATEDVLWEGRIEQTAPAAGRMVFGLVGALAQGRTSLDLGNGTQASYRGLKAARLDLSGKTDATGAASVRIDGDIALQQIDVATPDLKMTSADAAWQGKFGVQSMPDRRSGFDAEGRFESDALRVSLVSQGIGAAQSKFRWSGRIALDPAQGGKLSHSGSVAIEGISIDSQEPAINVLAAKAVALDGIEADGLGKWTAQRVAITGIESLGQLSAPQQSKALAAMPERAPVNLKALSALKLEYDGTSRLVAASVSVNGFDVNLVREKNGEFRLIGSLLALAAKSAVAHSEKTPAEPVPAAPAFSFAVGKWTIANGSRLRFVDRSAEPEFAIVVDALSGELTGVDSAKPNANVPIKLSSRIGKFSLIGASGTIRPFSEKLSLDIGGEISGFDLSSVSSYARAVLGYTVSRGRLDAAFKIAIKEGKLRGTNQLTITKLQVAPGKTKEAQAAAAALPLETALSLLKDSRDVITLDLPVTGDVGSPQFDFSDAINQAVAGALKKAVVGTLSLIFPVGGIIRAVTEAGLPDRYGLNPVAFDPGSAALSDDAGKFLEQLGKMLRQRPDVKLTICGVSTLQDREALLRQQRTAAAAAKSGAPAARPDAATAVPDIALRPGVLLNLAQSRGEAVKSRLVRQHGVGEDRLFLCAPKIDEAPNAAPRADIML